MIKQRNERRLAQVFVTSRESLFETARSHLQPAETIIDIGAGIHPQELLQPRVQLCIEPHIEYITHTQNQKRKNQATSYIYLNGTWEQALALIPDKSVDSVFANDVIEHLEKEDGFRMLAEAERVARVQVAIFTPLGFFPQHQKPNRRDRWGMNGGIWQTHRSGWMPTDFGKDWVCITCPDFHEVDENNMPLPKCFGAFWAIHNIFAIKSFAKKVAGRIARTLDNQIILSRR